MLRISVPIYDDRTRRALANLAERELRDPRDQAALLIVEGLRRRGLLPADPRHPDPYQLPETIPA
jgi:hypothetical protein